MKALSLWQPHAQAIALGLKPWETRDWSTSYRGPLAIHAAKRLWTDVGPWHTEARSRLDRHIALHGAVPWSYGAVVCVVDVTDCLPTRELRARLRSDELFWGDFGDGEIGAGRYAFRLENVRCLPDPLPWRGQQGFFEVELDGFAVRRDTLTLPLFGEG